MSGYILLDTPNTAQPQGTYPRRGGAKLSGTCIVHTSEGNWRSGVAGLTNLVRTRADWGCYHRACDWQDIALYYPWEWETWQDTETNNWAAGIAAACKTTDWATMPAEVREGFYRNMARMAADFVTYMRDEHGITVPLRRLSGAEARARKPGFAAHGDSGVARSDPGRDFNWDLFFQYTADMLGGTIQLQSTTAPKEWYEMPNLDLETKLAINEAVWGGPGMPLIHNYRLDRGEFPKTMLGALENRIQNEILPSVVGPLLDTIKSLAGNGSDLDVDDLLARIGKQVEDSSRAGAASAIEGIDVTVRKTEG